MCPPSCSIVPMNAMGRKITKIFRKNAFGRFMGSKTHTLLERRRRGESGGTAILSVRANPVPSESETTKGRAAVRSLLFEPG